MTDSELDPATPGGGDRWVSRMGPWHASPASPIGVGTQFRAVMGGGTPMLVTLTEYGRPSRARSGTRSSLLDRSGAITFVAEGTGTLMRWDWKVQPKGWLRRLGPTFAPVRARMERRIWESLRERLDSE